jgi:hypothetical protein
MFVMAAKQQQQKSGILWLWNVVETAYPPHTTFKITAPF